MDRIKRTLATILFIFVSISVVIIATVNANAAQNVKEPAKEKPAVKAPAAEPGDIEIIIIKDTVDKKSTDKATNSKTEKTGAVRVDVRLPGADGSLEKAPNILFDIVDGSDFDMDALVNGHILIRAKDIAGYIKSKQVFSVLATVKNYLGEEVVSEPYSLSTVNEVRVKMILNQPARK